MSHDKQMMDIDWNDDEAVCCAALGGERATGLNYQGWKFLREEHEGVQIFERDHRPSSSVSGERRNELMNSFGNGAYSDGQVQAEIDNIDSVSPKAAEAEKGETERSLTAQERFGIHLGFNTVQDRVREILHDYAEDGERAEGYIAALNMMEMEIDLLDDSLGDVTPTLSSGDAVAPLECTQCGRAVGPLATVDADHAGWICPDSYAKLQSQDADHSGDVNELVRDAVEGDLPALDITQADEDAVRKLFDVRPTSLLPTRQMQDATVIQAMVEMFCRQRQLRTTRKQLSQALSERDALKEKFEFVNDELCASCLEPRRQHTNGNHCPGSYKYTFTSGGDAWGDKVRELQAELSALRQSSSGEVSRQNLPTITKDMVREFLPAEDGEHFSASIHHRYVTLATESQFRAVSAAVLKAYFKHFASHPSPSVVQRMVDALEQITKQAKSWHDTHNHESSPFQCDSICELIPACVAALSSYKEQTKAGAK